MVKNQLKFEESLVKPKMEIEFKNRQKNE